SSASCQTITKITIHRMRSTIDSRSSSCFSSLMFRSPSDWLPGSETRGRNEIDVGLGLSAHQQLDDLSQRTPLEKDGMQACDQRHVDIKLLGTRLEYLQGIDPLGNFAQALHRLFQAEALAQGETHLIVAALG